MMSHRRFDRLLLDLYACPEESSRWHGVLDQVCLATGARSAIAQLMVKGGNRLCTLWMAGDSEAEATQATRGATFADEENPRMELSRRRALKPGTHVLRDSDLFTALCAGISLNQYALLHGVTIATARYQLKQVLAKTRTHRQPELVRQVCSSVMAYAFAVAT